MKQSNPRGSSQPYSCQHLYASDDWLAAATDRSKEGALSLLASIRPRASGGVISFPGCCAVPEAPVAAPVKTDASTHLLPAGRSVGHERYVTADRCGYDIESRVPDGGRLRVIGVKGRHKDRKTVTVTRNEILTAPNSQLISCWPSCKSAAKAGLLPRYVARPFQKELDFGVTSVNYATAEILGRAQENS